MNNIQKGDYLKAFEAFDMYINGDFWPYGTYYYNVTGLTSYFNFLDPVYPSNPYDVFLNLPETQDSINVRNTLYVHYNKTVETYLVDDWMRSVASVMPTLLDSYKVIFSFSFSFSFSYCYSFINNNNNNNNNNENTNNDDNNKLKIIIIIIKRKTLK